MVRRGDPPKYSLPMPAVREALSEAHIDDLAGKAAYPFLQPVQGRVARNQRDGRSVRVPKSGETRGERSARPIQCGRWNAGYRTPIPVPLLGKAPFRAPPALIRCMIGKLVKYGASERPILPSSVLTLEEPERRTERPSNYSPATGPAHRGGSTRFLARSSIRQAASASCRLPGYSSHSQTCASTRISRRGA
jgi:hypothetical protein